MNQRIRLDKATAEIIDKHSHLLNENMKEPFRKFKTILNDNRALTDGQHSYLEGMYECIMGKLTGMKCDVHIDLKNKHKTNLHY